MKARFTPRRVTGFTLVEVLVALAVVALGMSAVLGALTSAADNTSYLRDKTMAEWIALNRIAELRLGGQQPAEGRSNGEIEFANRRWRWEQEVQEIEIPGVVRIDVRIRPAEGVAGNDRTWLTTVSGVMGDAVGPANGAPSWPRGTGALNRPPGNDGNERELPNGGADPQTGDDLPRRPDPPTQ